VTYNSQPLTLIRKDEWFNSESRSTALYYLTDPPTGSAYPIQVNFSGLVYRSVGGAVSLTGVEQSNPVDAQAGVAGAAADTNPKVMPCVFVNQVEPPALSVYSKRGGTIELHQPMT
jgi:hypothetical protein